MDEVKDSNKVDGSPIVPETPEVTPAPGTERRDGGKVFLKDAKATAVWTKPETGEVVLTESVYRSLPAILDYVNKSVNKNKELDALYLKVNVDTEKADTPVTLIEGTPDQIIDYAEKHVISPQSMLHILSDTFAMLTNLSELKGVVITFVVGDAAAGGFGLLSDATEVTDSDIKVLCTAAANQIDQMKEVMRKQKNIVFPDDNNIIMPGSNPGGLRLVK